MNQLPWQQFTAKNELVYTQNKIGFAKELLFIISPENPITAKKGADV